MGSTRNDLASRAELLRQSLESENFLLRSVIDHSPDPIFVKDLANTYVLVNKSFLRVCHLEQAEGFTDEELFPPEFVRTIREHDDAVLREGRSWRAEEQLDIGGAIHTFLAIKFPLRTRDGAIFAMGGIASDITLQKEAESRNAELLAAKRAAQETADLKSAFIATISHELRTPVGGILGLVDLLREKPTPDTAAGFVENIGEAAGGLLRLVNDLLDLSKLESGKMNFESVQFFTQELLDGVCRTLEPSATAHDLRLELFVAAACPQYLVGDALRVRQVLLNLVGNAVKFSAHGDVRVSVDVVPASSKKLEPGSVELVFRVVDQGPGIRSEDIPKLFNAFSQLDTSVARRFGGTGLGLSICRSLVHGMGGEIGVQSRFGHGAEFWFTLPLKEGVATSQAMQSNPAALRPLQGSVLLVEDNAINQLVLSRMLQKIGLDVTLADNGRAAVRLTAERRFDVILMDCHMPEMDGFSATRAMRSRATQEDSQRVQIIALTASAMPEEKQRCLDAGMDDYLTKPVKIEVLHEHLDAALSSGKPNS